MAREEERLYGVSGFRVGAPHYKEHGSIFKDKVEVITDGYGNIVGVTNREKLFRLSLPEEIEGVSIDEIGAEAFANCQNLEMVFLPKSIEKIGYGAFKNCQNLRVVVMSENIYEIASSAFEDCGSLENVNMPINLDTIGSKAFYGCNSLRSVRLSRNVELGTLAFSSCRSLELFEADEISFIPDGLLMSSGVRRVKISKSVKSIGYSAFSRCSKLGEIYFDGSLSDFQNIKFGMNWNKDIMAKCALYLRDESGRFYNAFDRNNDKKKESKDRSSNIYKSDLELLGINSDNPTRNEIVSHYKEKARKFHPDVLSGLNLDKAFSDFASEQFRLYTEAYERLLKIYKT